MLRSLKHSSTRQNIHAIMCPVDELRTRQSLYKQEIIKNDFGHEKFPAQS